MTKSALITGVTGQDGLYLSELLLAKGYDVFGLVRPDGDQGLRLQRDVAGVRPVPGDLRDMASLVRSLEASQPDEVYNLAATSFAGLSWQFAELNAEVSALGTLRVLEALRTFTGGDLKGVRFYQASTSEIFGNAQESPQNESTPFYPRSPYGVAKVFAHNMTVNYRDGYGAFACCGILYNHESERRAHHFVTRKITSSVARISLGLQNRIELGGLDSTRDWGYAGDYVRAMWQMLQQPEPDDFVIATGVSHSIRDLLSTAFAVVDIVDWEPYVVQDPGLVRSDDGKPLVGDATRAATVLGWAPEVGFRQLVERMVHHDLRVESAAAGS